MYFIEGINKEKDPANIKIEIVDFNRILGAYIDRAQNVSEGIKNMNIVANTPNYKLYFPNFD